MRRRLVLAALVFAGAGPALARDSLGMFEGWGAFRDPGVPRCYAIALSEVREGKAGPRGYLDVGLWPKRQLRGKLHARLSRPAAEAPRLAIGGQRFEMAGRGSDAWPRDGRDEAAIVAALRSSATLTISARGADGKMFTDGYKLGGAASAIDSALVGCAG